MNPLSGRWFPDPIEFVGSRWHQRREAVDPDRDRAFADEIRYRIPRPGGNKRERAITGLHEHDRPPEVGFVARCGRSPRIPPGERRTDHIRTTVLLGLPGMVISINLACISGFSTEFLNLIRPVLPIRSMS